MALTTNLAGADNFVLQSAISAYRDEAYTNAKKLSGTGIVGTNPEIDTSTETFLGQVRWYKPINPVINVANLTDATNGTNSTYTSDFLRYIKTVRTHGATKVNMQQIVTQVDGLAKIGRDFAETQAQDEHNAILAVMKGVAITEALNGAAAGSGAAGLGGQSFTNDPADKRYGFYVDLGTATPVIAATVAVQGAARAEGFLNAISMAFKDYEPEYMYLVTSPEVFASLRSANLVNDNTITEGNVVFSTIFGGKIRLIQSRATQGMTSAQLTMINSGAGVDIIGTKTSFLVAPGALAMAMLDVPDSVEIFRDARAFAGGGATSIWHRWGYVIAPQGYNWIGSESVFPADTDYSKIVQAGSPMLLTAATSGLATGAVSGTWERKAASALSLGILPVFHS
jgi:hypothetical protein